MVDDEAAGAARTWEGEEGTLGGGGGLCGLLTAAWMPSSSDRTMMSSSSSDRMMMASAGGGATLLKEGMGNVGAMAAGSSEGKQSRERMQSTGTKQGCSRRSAEEASLFIIRKQASAAGSPLHPHSGVLHGN